MAFDMKHMATIIGGILLSSLAYAGERPNVLFICVDDLRPQLGCYGNARMKTPHIDRLAARGVLFERAYCQFAICGPSRASVLSGMYPENNGIQDNARGFRAALPDVATLPQHFRNHGYETVGMGKIFHHMGATDPASWSRWEDIPGRGYFLPRNIADQKRRQADLAEREAAGETFAPHQKYVLTVGPFSEAAEADETRYPDGELAGRAVQTLRGFRSSEKPWFLAIGFLKPHLPFVVPKKYWDLYDPDSFALPGNGTFPKGAPSYHVHNSFELRSYSDVPKQGPLDEALLRRAMHGYHAACSFVDAQVGRVLDELARLDLAEDTIVVFWGDNGFHLGENAIIGKDTNFEAAAHCPLIIAGPGLAPERTGRLAELVDIYPTLCGMAGIPVAEQCDGRHLFSKPWKTAAFTMNARLWNNPNAGYAMRTDRYRYIRWRDAGGATVAEELYDYRCDPPETDNLAGHPEYRDVLRKLRARFEAESPLAGRAGPAGVQKP